MSSEEYQLVELAGGAWSLRPLREAETFHPGVGPAAEADTVYARPLQLCERMAALGGSRDFVVWDVGLGAAANALSAFRAVAEVGGRIQIHSFDRTLGALAFALRHADRLGYLAGFEGVIGQLLTHRCVSFTHGSAAAEWIVHGGDFPDLLCSAPADAWPEPDAILYDPHSPRRNPEMWTLPLLRALRQRVGAGRPCNLATYSRSTLLRVSLLRAGFHVGTGPGHAMKEETTVAATVPELAGRLLDGAWLQRAVRSSSAEPLDEPVYRQLPLSAVSRHALAAHPQFAAHAGQLYGSDKTFAPCGTDMA